jgi:energy-coupling factor transport system permease protein
MKLLLLVAYVFSLFASGEWLGLVICTAILLVCYRIAHISLKRAARGLLPVLFILAFTFLANALTFLSPPVDAMPQDTLVTFWGTYTLPQSIPLIGSFGVRPLGALMGIYFALRIVLLVSVTTLLTFTTPIVSLTDAVSQILRPLRALRVPVDDIAMMFTIALRFIPLTAEEAEKIIVAQTARGAHFKEGGPIKRARAYVPVLIPLVVSLFRRADALAGAMEGRCYAGRGRTRLNDAKLSGSDVAIGVIGAAALVVIGILL